MVDLNEFSVYAEAVVVVEVDGVGVAVWSCWPGLRRRRGGRICCGLGGLGGLGGG
jgi:hypothetical protein